MHTLKSFHKLKFNFWRSAFPSFAQFSLSIFVCSFVSFLVLLFNYRAFGIGCASENPGAIVWACEPKTSIILLNNSTIYGRSAHHFPSTAVQNVQYRQHVFNWVARLSIYFGAHQLNDGLLPMDSSKFCRKLIFLKWNGRVLAIAKQVAKNSETPAKSTHKKRLFNPFWLLRSSYIIRITARGIIFSFCRANNSVLVYARLYNNSVGCVHSNSMKLIKIQIQTRVQHTPNIAMGCGRWETLRMTLYSFHGIR